jgi:hypothetical protein
MFDRNPLESLMSMPGVQSAALGNGGMPYSGWRSSYSLEEILAAEDQKINISLISGNFADSWHSVEPRARVHRGGSRERNERAPCE